MVHIVAGWLSPSSSNPLIVDCPALSSLVGRVTENKLK